MGRIRTIKPEFFRSRSLAECPPEARLTFAGLWTEADDHGRGRAEPRLLKGALWAMDDACTHLHVAAHLNVLAATGHIRLYEVDGEPYYEIINWDDHQAASHRRGSAVYPSSDADGAVALDRMQESADRTYPGAGTGNWEQGTGSGDAPSVTTSPQVDEPEDRQRRFSVLADVCGLDVSNLTRNERGRLNDAEEQLREVGAQPAEIKAKAAAYRDAWPDATLTPQALANNWAQLEVSKTTQPKGREACPECGAYAGKCVATCPTKDKVSA